MTRPIHALFVSGNGADVPICLSGDGSVEVMPCKIGIRAIEEIERSHPDVVILDAGDDFHVPLQFFYSLRSVGGPWPVPRLSRSRTCAAS